MFQLLKALSPYADHSARNSVTINSSEDEIAKRDFFFTHFGLPGYTPKTIAVNVTWVERGFNAGQTHCSI